MTLPSTRPMQHGATPTSVTRSGATSGSNAVVSEPVPSTTPATLRSGRIEPEAIRALASVIHRELRESLSAEEVLGIATELVGKVAAELRERREGAKTVRHD